MVVKKWLIKNLLVVWYHSIVYHIWYTTYYHTLKVVTSPRYLSEHLGILQAQLRNFYKLYALDKTVVTHSASVRYTNEFWMA